MLPFVVVHHVISSYWSPKAFLSDIAVRFHLDTHLGSSRGMIKSDKPFLQRYRNYDMNEKKMRSYFRDLRHAKHS